MARFTYEGSFRADVFLRLLQGAEALLEAELRGELLNKSALEEVANAGAGWLSSAADTALVVGLSREDWLKAYDDNKAYYEQANITLK